jgi:hypothetical protein
MSRGVVLSGDRSTVCNHISGPDGPVPEASLGAGAGAAAAGLGAAFLAGAFFLDTFFAAFFAAFFAFLAGFFAAFLAFLAGALFVFLAFTAFFAFFFFFFAAMSFTPWFHTTEKTLRAFVRMREDLLHMRMRIFEASPRRKQKRRGPMDRGALRMA